MRYENVTNEDEKVWLNKRAKIEILKDGKTLFYTALVLEYDSSHITFKDRDGSIFSFNRNLVMEMQEVRT